jgi:hypothetical protein
MLLEMSVDRRNVTVTGEFHSPNNRDGQQAAELIKTPSSGHESAWSRFKNTKTYRRLVLPGSVLIGGGALAASLIGCGSSEPSRATETALASTLRPAAVSIADKAITLHREYPGQVKEQPVAGSKDLVQISGISTNGPNTLAGLGGIDAVIPVVGGKLEPNGVVYASAQFVDNQTDQSGAIAIKGPSGASAANSEYIFNDFGGGQGTHGWVACDGGASGKGSDRASSLLNTSNSADYFNPLDGSTPTAEGTAQQIASDVSSTLDLAAIAFGPADL